jgi:hypothetical protein
VALDLDGDTPVALLAYPCFAGFGGVQEAIGVRLREVEPFLFLGLVVLGMKRRARMRSIPTGYFQGDDKPVKAGG